MSGHSKWHNIQAKKGKADKAKSSAFTKIARLITVAAQQGGGDAEMNFSLRLAIDKAKAVNMPKDNIERAIQRGSGELKGEISLQQILYEGFGPGGVAVLVEVVTDNTNRSASEIKNAFTKNGGSMGVPGAVKWQFDYKGVVRFTAEKKSSISNWDELQLQLMDRGADDIIETEDGVEIICSKENFQNIMGVITSAGLQPDDSGLQWIAKEEMSLDDETSSRMQHLYEILDELDDVREVYTNEK